MPGRDSLEGQSFLDIDSGSGRFSLAARQIGARVVSFDYDADSVACTAELRRRYFPDDEKWTVGRGDVTSASFMDELGRFDVVYSLGGVFYIALYTDQGAWSHA